MDPYAAAAMNNGGGGQPQFRYNQPPSKVLHVRNLPWECKEEELEELCKPFGRVINTKLNVGANHNQAFVEFLDLNQAIQMVSYYASSPEPAQVRGKAVYLQYSTRQEIVTTKQSGDVASNVLLVTIEGVEAGDVPIDKLHIVFSAFGFVQKIATFEKNAGFQALVQFADPNVASSAKSNLEGRSIPRYLLPDHVTNCSLRISFSAHNDLNVKFQSHRSRDYTNPYLPVAPSATDASGHSNVLLVSIENMQYDVSIDVLHTVFSAFGTVQKIAIFTKTAGFQALVQYPDVDTAVKAKDALEGHCVYDGGFCKLRLSFSRHTDLNVKSNNDRSRDYTNPTLPPSDPPGAVSPVAGGMLPTSGMASPAGPMPPSGGMPSPASGPGWPMGGPPPVLQQQQLQQHQQAYMGQPYQSAPPTMQQTGPGTQSPFSSWDYENAHSMGTMSAKGPPPGGMGGPPQGGPPPQYGSAPSPQTPPGSMGMGGGYGQPMGGGMGHPGGMPMGGPPQMGGPQPPQRPGMMSPQGGPPPGMPPNRGPPGGQMGGPPSMGGGQHMGGSNLMMGAGGQIGGPPPSAPPGAPQHMVQPGGNRNLPPMYGMPPQQQGMQGGPLGGGMRPPPGAPMGGPPGGNYGGYR
eukprot:TRINITY_DN880_c3_g1_i2.p1 TRINITY_DN880_c3_g1~~TRINITY_DN880_c3_g1_i2.p1  ORF type:complete len:629 (-),score=137.41 TRINITY_DN880_c3_g1_i2:361-2247(-)